MPVREAGALLPQLALSARVRSSRRIAPIWAVGALGQGAAVLGMAAALLTLEGPAAGWAVVALLAAFAASRSMCSVTYKPLQGATLETSTRGTASGLAGSIAATLVLAYGALMATSVLPVTIQIVAALVAFAGLLWVVAATLLSGLQEEDREGWKTRDEYQGVRLGRSTHLVDMAPAADRAAYAAVSNSVIGVVLLFGGAFGWIAEQLGPHAALFGFAALSIAATAIARNLKEVQYA